MVQRIHFSRPNTSTPATNYLKNLLLHQSWRCATTASASLTAHLREFGILHYTIHIRPKGSWSHSNPVGSTVARYHHGTTRGLLYVEWSRVLWKCDHYDSRTVVLDHFMMAAIWYSLGRVHSRGVTKSEQTSKYTAEQNRAEQIQAQ
jgi:hypothetical protein